MTQQLFIIDSLRCPKTTNFWRRHQASFLSAMPEAEMIFVDSSAGSIDLPPKLDRVMIVGTDAGCSRVINLIYPPLANEGVLVTFLPSEGDSALCQGLNYPPDDKSLLALLRSKNHIMMSLVRCHCTDFSGGPQSWLVLNDILLRLPQPKLPRLLQGVLGRLLFARGFNAPKSLSQISLMTEHKVVYNGAYLFAVILLGSQVTHGPQLCEIQRGFQHKFRYYQINQTQSFTAQSLRQLFSEGNDAEVYTQQFSQLEVRAVGEEHALIADGVEIGHLPASFTLLPRALKVSSPLLATPVKSSFKARFNKAELPSLPKAGSRLLKISSTKQAAAQVQKTPRVKKAQLYPKPKA